MQLFRSLVTVIVVGTMAVMIFSLRSELAVAKAKAKGGESKSVIADRPHVFSMSCKVPSCNQTGVLLLDYLIGAMKRSGKLPEKFANEIDIHLLRIHRFHQFVGSHHCATITMRSSLMS